MEAKVTNIEERKLDEKHNTENKDKLDEKHNVNGSEKKTVCAQPYDWYVEDYENESLNVFIWCLTREHKPVLFRVLNFPAYCYVELPQFVNGRYFKWTKGNADDIATHIGRVLHDDAPTSAELVYKTKLYYYRQRTYPMLLMKFATQNAMHHMERVVRKGIDCGDYGKLKLDVHETDIPITTKINTIVGMRFTQWIKVDVEEVPREDKISTITEYNIQWEDIKPVPPSESAGWVTKPKILSFDIECYSNRHKAMPNKLDAKHVAYMISCITQRFGEPSTRKRAGIIYGDCNNIPPERLKDCHIIRVDSEMAMIEAFGNLVKEEDPDVISGYNTTAFDYPYLNARIKRQLEEWPFMGRLVGRKTEMTTKTWESSAYGKNSISSLTMHGRISIDMLPIVKRDYKLDKYDLDTVSKEFLKKGKHDIKASEMFKIYEAMQKSITLLNLIKVIDEHKITDVNKLQSHVTKNKLDVTAEEVKMCIQHPGEVKKLHQKALDDMTKVMEYAIQDAELVIELMDKINIWYALIEMSSIVFVTVTQIFTSGQQIRCLSQLYNKAFARDIVLDKQATSITSFAGGAVDDPVRGLHGNTICLDFASLYPSIMQAFNTSHETLIPPELMDEIPDKDCNVIEFDQEEDINPKRKSDEDDEAEEDFDEEEKETKKRKVHYKFKFIKQPFGLLPELVKALVDERNAVKKQIKQVEYQLKITQKLANDLKDHDDKSLQQVEQDVLIECLSLTKDIALIKAKLTELKGSNDKEQILANNKDLKAKTEKYNSLSVLNTHFTAAQSEYKDKTANYKTFMVNFIKVKIGNYDLLLIVLDKRQNGLKISANSFFGFTGAANGGKRPCPEIAMSITAWGRQLKGEVGKYVETKYNGRVIYGDTDSVMCGLGITDPREVNKMGKRLADEISGTPEMVLDDGTVVPAKSGLFPPPLRMEFEKGMLLLCLKKKNYIYAIIDDNGNIKIRDKETGKHCLKFKGIALARRDKNGFLREMLLELILATMEGKPFLETVTYIVNKIKSLIEGKVDHKKFVIIKTMGAAYKSPSYPMRLFGEHLKSIGKPAQPGDRLEYVIVKNNETYTGKKMRMIETYLENKETEPIDYMYYLEKLIAKSINFIFSVGYMADIAKYPKVGFKPTNRHKFIGLDKICNILLKMAEYNVDFDKLLNNLRPKKPRVVVIDEKDEKEIRVAQKKIEELDEKKIEEKKNDTPIRRRRIVVKEEPKKEETPRRRRVIIKEEPKKEEEAKPVRRRRVNLS